MFVGRLYQVEYAMEAIGHAGTCLGILANDGVLLAAERRNIHKLLDEVFFSEKIYKLNEWVVTVSISQLVIYFYLLPSSDCNIWCCVSEYDSIIRSLLSARTIWFDG